MQLLAPISTGKWKCNETEFHFDITDYSVGSLTFQNQFYDIHTCFYVKKKLTCITFFSNLSSALNTLTTISAINNTK